MVTLAQPFTRQALVQAQVLALAHLAAVMAVAATAKVNGVRVLFSVYKVL
jgi:hypothetical protein|tara:strand:+ start:2308 stop:2457 length:150 start_codon:yes stop_codon:yes gene_type:complete